MLRKFFTGNSGGNAKLLQKFFNLNILVTLCDDEGLKNTYKTYFNFSYA